MKSAHPNWRLAYYLLPPISLSLIFTVFFPTLIFQVLVGLVVVSLIPTLWLGINTLKNVTFLGALSNVTVFPSFLSHSKNLMGATQWLFSILGLIFLLGMSGISLSVLTAASQLAPDLLTWGSVTKIWRLNPTCMTLSMLNEWH